MENKEVAGYINRKMAELKLFDNYESYNYNKLFQFYEHQKQELAFLTQKLQGKNPVSDYEWK